MSSLDWFVICCCLLTTFVVYRVVLYHRYKFVSFKRFKSGVTRFITRTSNLAEALAELNKSGRRLSEKVELLALSNPGQIVVGVSATKNEKELSFSVNLLKDL